MGTPPTPLEQLDFSVLQQCMHCGLCLPTCPTYAETGREPHSPRGRIALMRAVAEYEIPATTAFAEEMNYCLGCLACTSACPAGVDYRTLIEAARQTAIDGSGRPNGTRAAFRWFVFRKLFGRQRWMHAAARALRLYQRGHYAKVFRRFAWPWLLPRNWRSLEQAAPKVGRRFSDEVIRAVETPARVRHRVLLLTGCVQDVVFAEVNRATADVLLANDCEVLTPRRQGCCGSLHAHNGDLAMAKSLARQWLDRVDLAKLDAIVSNAAGCGSHLKHYGALLRDEPSYRARAEEWDRKCYDVSEFLVHIAFRPPATSPFPRGAASVTYHDACHLCHGQGIVRQPRAVLRAIPGVELRECTESTWCCGAAGIYAVTHPETAHRLRDRKWAHLSATGADIAAMANPGCALHLAPRAGDPARAEIVHPVVLLARAYAAEKEPRN